MLSHRPRLIEEDASCDASANNAFIPFCPQAQKPFQFTGQIEEGKIFLTILWNKIGQCYWIQVKHLEGNFLIYRPLTGSKSITSKRKFDLLDGTSQSKLYFYEDIQSFHIIL